MKKLMPIVSALLLSMSIGLFHSCGQPVSNPSIGQIPSTGINEEEEPFVQSLDIISMPKKTTYKEGEVFDPAGMLLKATWSHMDDETGTNIVEELTGYDVTYSKTPFKSGDKSIEVSYEGKSVSIPITVSEFKITELTIVQMPTMTVFSVDDSFKLDGMILQAVSENGEKLTITEGYTVTIGGSDVTTKILSTGVKLTAGNHTVTIGYKGKTVSFEVTVFSGVTTKVEAEKILGSSKYPQIVESDKNYIEPNAAYEFSASEESKFIISKEGEPASGNAYLGEFNKVGKGVTLHYNAKVTGKANVFIAASSGVISAGSGWTPTSMKDIQINQMLSVSVNNNPVTIADDVILPGGTIEDVGEGNNGLLWVNWKVISLGEFDLVAGDNSIYIEIIKVEKHASNTGSGAINIDYFDVID